MENQDCQPSLWLTETFSTPLQLLNGIQRNLVGSKIATPSTKFLFFGPIWKPGWPPCLWFAVKFSTSCLEPLNGIQQNLAGSKIATPSTNFLFLGPIGKPGWPPCLWFAEKFSTSCLEPRNGIQRTLTGGKYSTSSTKFVFFWPLVISIHACFFPRKGTRVYDCGPLVLLKCVNRSDLCTVSQEPQCARFSRVFTCPPIV